MLITKEIEIDMAHRVPNHKSKCRNLHGHRYKIEVGVDDKVIDEEGRSDEGMVIDFSDLKEIMMREIDERYDHGAVFYSEDTLAGLFHDIRESGEQSKDKVHFVDFIPTAENLCQMWFSIMREALKEKGIAIHHVKVWETPTSTAIYTINDQKTMCEKCENKGMFPGDAAKAEENTKTNGFFTSLLKEIVKDFEKENPQSELQSETFLKIDDMFPNLKDLSEDLDKQKQEDKKSFRIQDLTSIFSAFMEEMGLDMEDASLKDTPKRVAKMFVNETCKGLYEDPPKITTFPNDEKYTGMVVVKDIQIQSLCEHHFQPFVGKCHIAYIPGDRVVGLSKFARVADHFSRRPQVQERLTKNIFDHLKKVLGTENIAVVIDSEHFCMKLRGVMDPCSSTSTDMMGGLFLHSDSTRNEFLRAVERKS